MRVGVGEHVRVHPARAPCTCMRLGWLLQAAGAGSSWADGNGQWQLRAACVAVRLAMAGGLSVAALTTLSAFAAAGGCSAGADGELAESLNLTKMFDFYRSGGNPTMVQGMTVNPYLWSASLDLLSEYPLDIVETKKQDNEIRETRIVISAL